MSDYYNAALKRERRRELWGNAFIVFLLAVLPWLVIGFLWLLIVTFPPPARAEEINQWDAVVFLPPFGKAGLPVEVEPSSSKAQSKKMKGVLHNRGYRTPIDGESFWYPGRCFVVATSQSVYTGTCLIQSSEVGWHRLEQVSGSLNHVLDAFGAFDGYCERIGILRVPNVA